MKTTRICPKCLQPLPENAPEGLCPQCLAKAAFETEPAARNEAAPPSPAQLAPFFPQLEIIELLGQGGMGIVYKARQPHLDRLVALKVLPMDSAPHPAFADRFNREARALARLNHPGIVTVYDFGHTGQYYYFIMEYVDGMNLRGLLQSHPVEPRQALELVVQICTSLQYAHDKGVVHRDIKPENILISKEGQLKIADFGLAKLLGVAPDTALTMSKEAMGTLNYMAPEQRKDAQKVDHRADIYSLGVVFYEMLTGEVPMGRFEPPSRKVQVDVRLDEVVLKALEREPSRRYQQVNEVKTGIETITSDIPREKSAAYEPEPFKPRRQEETLWTRLAISGYEFKVIVATLLLLGFMTWGAALCFRNNAYGSATIVIVAELGSIVSVGQTVYGRRAERRAREKGLWPQFGEIPTVEHVKRLAQSGQKSLAIKLYRRICPVSLGDAREVVQGLARGPGAPAPTLRQPTFVRQVVIPMVVVSLLWLALLLLAPKFPFLRSFTFDSGVALLTVALPLFIFEWRRKLAGRGLRWKDLPPAVRRRGALQIALATIPCLVLLIPSLIVGPSHTQEWREDYFYPKSRAYEKLDFSGHISGYQLPFWSEHSFGGSGAMAIRIYGTDSAPATLTVSLPDLHLQNTSPDPSQPPRSLTFGVLTNWLHESARLDTARPQVQAEAQQVMDLFEPYYERAPGSWDEFATESRSKLRDFDLGGSNVNMREGGGVLFFIHMLPVYMGACLCLFYFLALRALKRAFAEGRAEIEAGRCTSLKREPQPQSPAGLPTAPAQAGQQRFAYSDLYATAGYILAILVAWFAGTFVPILGLVLFLGLLLAGVRGLTSRLQVQRARERGLWPPLGTVATDEHVKLLAQAGERVLATRLYRQVHGVSRANAKSAVETLTGQLAASQKLAAPQASARPSTPAPAQPRLSRTALAGAACLIVLIGVLTYSSVFDLSTPPLNHQERVPRMIDAQGRVTSTQEIMVAGPGTWWRVEVLVSIVLGAAAALGTAICGWVAATQIQRSAGALYGLGLALFDGLIIPLLLLTFMLYLHNPFWALLCVVFDYFIIRTVYRGYREGMPSSA